jgi:abhydrolase domain-containing protein 6
MLIDLLHQQVRSRYIRHGFKSRTLELERCTMHFLERRRDESPFTVILLHGLGTSSSTWVNLIPALDTTMTVLAPDLPGHGLSTIRSGEPFFRLSELHQSVATFIHEIASGPCVLVGHSLGGWLAAHHATENPKNIRHLILVDSAGILNEETIDQGKAFQLESLGDLRRLMNTLWFKYPWYFKLFYSAVFNDLRERRVSGFVRTIRRQDFLNEQLKNLTMKVSIVWGKEDRLISTKSLEIARHALPHAHIYLIEQCGHVPQLERPKEFNALINEILNDETEVARD